MQADGSGVAFAVYDSRASLLVALVVIETTDLVPTADSVPAVLAVTQKPLSLLAVVLPTTIAVSLCRGSDGTRLKASERTP